ncbi:MAG: hypothetical protein A3A97_03205 [Candidatus Terrybacteria bacterium RIFCSPLOWO2_01_FULL_40_23]|uniref:Uncharacterized protein n=1 Tax=Candidatus Terrybacteria bacterium RIFCSPLOWO2_01_FULL_40_23 TaxID=1802366 RepID=A0A1G2PQD5_9BACT|nr:MAG: hypothetical protein A3A97_03205 [Candidatus Terrybacteria bacterium RIFCSPLOWO2_01_FULL_40_23]
MKYQMGSRFNIFIPNIEAGALLENFLIAAVSSLLLIRAFLNLTGYPQFGSGDWHIAHMLWGGMLMMASIFMLLWFLDKNAKRIAAIIGGVGFGAFIDELGKFLTSDNNYFFQPTIVLIYIIFVFLFLVVRAIEKYIKLSNKDYAINALEVMKEVVLYDLDEQERQRALHFLELSDHDNPAVEPLKKMLSSLEGKPVKKIGILTRFKKLLYDIYIELIQKKWFVNVLVFYFIVFAIFNLSIAYEAIQKNVTFNTQGQFISSIISLAFSLLGTYFIVRDKRLLSYEMFKDSVIVSLFLTQFFLFYTKHWFGLFILIINLLILVVSQYLIEQEQIIYQKQKHIV